MFRDWLYKVRLALAGQGGPKAQELRAYMDERKLTLEERRRVCVVDGAITATLHLHYHFTRRQATEWASNYLLTSSVSYGGIMREPTLLALQTAGEDRDLLMPVFINFLTTLGMPLTHTLIDRAADMVVVAIQTHERLKLEDEARQNANRTGDTAQAEERKDPGSDQYVQAPGGNASGD